MLAAAVANRRVLGRKPQKIASCSTISGGFA
jgi:hypothetical protein